MNKSTRLEKAADEVKYEIQMFEELYNSFNNPEYTKTQFKRNILIESFVVHAYCLFRFFYQGEKEIKNKKVYKRRPSDIIAEDFDINRQKFRKNRTPKKDLNIIEKKRNKQIAHLTYNRIYRNKKTKPWKVNIIYKRLNKTMWAFISSLPEKNKNFF
jgi:hypothetical protein